MRYPVDLNGIPESWPVDADIALPCQSSGTSNCLVISHKHFIIMHWAPTRKGFCWNGCLCVVIDVTVCCQRLVFTLFPFSVLAWFAVDDDDDGKS